MLTFKLRRFKNRISHLIFQVLIKKMRNQRKKKRRKRSQSQKPKLKVKPKRQWSNLSQLANKRPLILMQVSKRRNLMRRGTRRKSLKEENKVRVTMRNGFSIRMRVKKNQEKSKYLQ